jgi:hypothetical protein
MIAVKHDHANGIIDLQQSWVDYRILCRCCHDRLASMFLSQWFGGFDFSACVVKDAWF